MERRSQISSILRCPSCSMEMQTESQMKEHCEFEIEDLKKIQNDFSNNTENSSQNQQPRKPYSVFQRIQRNRQSRLKQRSRKRSTPPTATPAEHACPICNVHYPPNEIQRHAEQCLRKSNGVNGHSSNEDDDGDDGCEEYEEYEWAGQKRIRASSLLEGGYASIGIGQCVSSRNCTADDEDEDLNVDEDDTTIYGPAQYNEADVIPVKRLRNGDSATHIDTTTDEEDVTSYMRSLITAGETKPSGQLDKNATGNETSLETESNSLNCHPSSSAAVVAVSSPATSTSLSTKTLTQQNASHYQQIIDSLKTKLRHYENHIPSKYKCLICLDDYRNPAISVSCWHVHCEECWLRSLGARKLCPQCNLITTPKDLRRIYM